MNTKDVNYDEEIKKEFSSLDELYEKAALLDQKSNFLLHLKEKEYIAKMDYIRCNFITKQSIQCIKYKLKT